MSPISFIPLPPDRMSLSILIDPNRTNATVQIAIHPLGFQVLHLQWGLLW